MSRAEAAIRSVATAVAIGWLPFFALIPALFGRFQSSWNADRLQLGFVSTFLVLGGLAGGTTLGILRWRQQAGQTTDVSQRGLVKNLLQGELRASVAYWQMDDGEGAFKVKLG